MEKQPLSDAPSSSGFLEAGSTRRLDDFTSQPTSASSDGGAGGSSSSSSGSRFGFFSVGYYRPYFDVDTVDVLQRLRDAIFPFPKSRFLEMTALNPDVYGPFWICSTLVFLSSSLGNLCSYISYALYSTADDEPWHYNIRAVSWAASIFFCYVAFVPIALYFLLRYLSVAAGLVQLLCLYGYSLAIFIPISFLSLVPLELMRWLVVLGGTAVSAVFLGVNLKAQITEGHELWLPIVVGAMVLQAGLGLVLKLFFFTSGSW